MNEQFVLTGYVEHALAEAVFDKLDDGTYSGNIPSCKGVLSFGSTLRGCQQALQSILEDWILMGLKLNHPLPVISGIDLNKGPVRESVEPL